MIEERIEKLEKENRRLKKLFFSLFVLFVGILFMGVVEKASVPGIIKGRQFILVDEKGRTRAKLAMESGPVFFLLDEKGEIKASLSLIKSFPYLSLSHNRDTITLDSKHLSISTTLSGKTEGNTEDTVMLTSHGLSIYHTLSKKDEKSEMKADFSPISLSLECGKMSASLTPFSLSLENGEQKIDLYNIKNDQRLEFSNRNGGTILGFFASGSRSSNGLTLYDEKGNPRASFGIDSNEDPSLSFWGRDEKIRVSIRIMNEEGIISLWNNWGQNKFFK